MQPRATDKRRRLDNRERRRQPGATGQREQHGLAVPLGDRDAGRQSRSLLEHIGGQCERNADRASNIQPVNPPLPCAPAQIVVPSPPSPPHPPHTPLSTTAKPLD